MNWSRSDGWLSDTPIGLWHGVAADDDCSVTHLNLHSNGLSGFLPSELGGLAHLVQLELTGNQLGGGIPLGLGDLGDLETLLLGDNQLSGEIPPNLGNLVNLTFLNLRRNELIGETAEVGQPLRADRARSRFELPERRDTPELGNLTL